MKETFEKVQKWISENDELVKKIKADNSWNSPLQNYKNIIYIDRQRKLLHL